MCVWMLRIEMVGGRLISFKSCTGLNFFRHLSDGEAVNFKRSTLATGQDALAK